MKRISIIALLLTLVVACKEEPKDLDAQSTNTIDTDTIEVETTEKPSYPYNRKYNDVAQFLAGNNGDDSSLVKALEQTETFKNYQKNLDALWKKTNAKLPVIKEWSQSEMEDINNGGGTLFYPFSGADFLHADLFFPQYDNYVMMALEPAGTFPDLLQKQANDTLAPYMNQLKRSMNAILGLSFFRTIAMADDFKNELDGTLHVLMHFMARTDHEVLWQEKVGILPNGDLTTDIESLSDSSYVGNRYYFRRNGDDKVKTLSYFAVNVQNSPYVSRGGLVAKGLETRTDLVNYFKKINIKATYLKSASYLMHRPTFSIIRNTILDESEYLLQDDSGIPVQFFIDGRWDLTFYGTYSFPISLFAERHQEDLKEIYQKKTETVKPLPFGIGYQYHKGTSNLMIARKKQ